LFVALMRRYCIDYTARHDLSVCDDIMVPGYTLHMGVHHLAGRDDAYKPAAAAQFRQFPGLCLTVNEIICSGDRLALRFTEHGASIRHDGARAAWGGVGLYRWDGQRLLENHVEQDYFGRRRQLAGDGPDPVEAPAVAPWDTRSVRADLAAEAVVRDWLAAGRLPRGAARPAHRRGPALHRRRRGDAAPGRGGPVAGGKVAGGRVITDRLGLLRRLTKAGP
jgi:predicted ester cyclase